MAAVGCFSVCFRAVGWSANKSVLRTDFLDRSRRQIANENNNRCVFDITLIQTHVLDMSDEDVFDDVVEDAIDEFITPTLRPNEDSPGVPSGVSSGSGPSTSSPAVQAEPVTGRAQRKSTGTVLACSYSGCKKSYKTQKGYDNHVFTHKITEINLRKPNTQDVMEKAEGIIRLILEELVNESFSSECKKNLIKVALENTGKHVSEWAVFVDLVSKPILEILTKRTKLLPRNQYEESLSQLNVLLNDDEVITRIREQFIKFLPEDHELQQVGFIIFQLCTRLSEEFQMIILRQIRKNETLVPTSIVSSTRSQVEMKLYADKIGSIIRNYYSRATAIRNNDVWNTRSECLRLRFMVFVDDIPRKEIVKKLLWIEGKISVADSVLECCDGLECVIKNFRENTSEPVIADTVIKSLLENENEIVNIWHTLTSGYFAELDSLLFMRDFVKIFINLALRLEESRLQRLVGEQRLQKFATRDNLKRN
ncbi:Phospholipase A1 member A [Frankliniella fusca]|uniref:Phospholipase A1 member A n=1 Tax=Frankliniella fusca TaxID=407009 RepID=A0AAE1HG67_9NEOP|nr:Phospholipase A1 member A [Frankliniella fusca]